MGTSGRSDTSRGEYDPSLFDLLRKRRKEIADSHNLPPFAILHDRTLREMAASLPGTREELAEVYGIGAAKLDKYGDTFLEIIRQYHPQEDR